MPRPLPADYLQPDEEILEDQGRHPLSIVDGLIGLLVLWLLLMGSAGFLVWALARAQFWTFVWIPWGLVTLLVAWGGLLLWFRATTSRYVVTPQRVYKAYGRFRFHLSLTTYDKVTDMHVHQSFFGRIWDFGTVQVETPGSCVSMEGVRQPFRFKHRIEQARDAFIRSLVASHAPALGRTQDAQAEVEAADLEEAAPLWQKGPCAASFMAGLITMGIAFFFLLAFGLVGLFFEPGIGGLVVAGTVLLAALMVWAMWVQYRYTRFHVYPDGVVVTRGWLTRHRVETTYDKVTDVTTYQDILGRIFDYGRITINTAGSNMAPVVFQGVKKPDEVKRIIDEARRRRR